MRRDRSDVFISIKYSRIRLKTLEDIFNPIERDAWIFADDEEDFIVHPLNIYENKHYRISKTKVESIKTTNPPKQLHFLNHPRKFKNETFSNLVCS